MIFGTVLSDFNIGLMKYGRVRWQGAEATRKDFNTVLTRQNKKFFISELLKVIHDANPLFLHYRTMSFIPNNFFEYIYQIGCAVSLYTLHHKFRIVTGRTDFGQGRQTVFFTAVETMDKEHKDPYTVDSTAPRLVWYKQKTWKRHQDTVYWVDVQLAQRKGLKFYQSRSNAIILHDTLPASCIPKVVRMESEEIMYEKVYVSPRPPPKISFKDNWLKELDSEFEGSSKDSQRIQPKSKTQSQER